MEVDAFLLLVLSAYVAQDLGWWVLSIGLLRYAFVAAGMGAAVDDGDPAAPVLAQGRHRRRRDRPHDRRVGADASGCDVVVTLLALGLLIESFGRDVSGSFADGRADPPLLSPGALRHRGQVERAALPHQRAREQYGVIDIEQ